MTVRRALVVTDLDSGLAPTAEVLSRFAPGLQVLEVLAGPGQARDSHLGGSGQPTPVAHLTTFDALRAASAALAVEGRAQLVPRLRLDTLIQQVLSVDAEWVVCGSRSLSLASLTMEVGLRLKLPVLFPSPGAAPPSPSPHVQCTAWSERGLAPVAAFLAAHAEGSWRVTLHTPSIRLGREELASFLAAAAIPAPVEVVRAGASLRQWLDDPPGAPRADLLVFSRMPVPLLIARRWSAPVVVLPPGGEAPAVPRHALDVTDAVDAGDGLCLRVGEVSAWGGVTPVADEWIALVASGRRLALAATSPLGELRLPAVPQGPALGLLRTSPGDPSPGTVPEVALAIVRPLTRPVLLFDAGLPKESLVRLHSWLGDRPGLEPLGVRLLPQRPARELRARFEAAGLTAHLLDARAVLDEGPALDVSEYNDAVRLERVAARLERAAFTVAALFDRGLVRPRPPTRPTAARYRGNRLELELDNATGRRWLLDAIADSRDSVCLQAYMAADDDIGRQVEGALVGRPSAGWPSGC